MSGLCSISGAFFIYTPPKPLPQPTSARGPLPQVPQRHPRVAKRSSDRFSARRPCPQVLQRHPSVARLSGTGVKPVPNRCSDRSAARRPLPQVPQWHHRVAKRASIGTLAREPSTEALLGQGRVPKGRESVPLPGLWSGSRPGSARGPCPQMSQWHPRVAKVACGRSSPRRPCPQTPQGHPRVAKGLSIGSLAGLRHGDPPHRYLSGITAWRDRHQSHVPPARDIHRASEYALHPPGTALGLLGVLLEGPLCNRHRQPTPASATQNRPMTGLHPSSDCSSDRFKALSCPLLIRGKCIFFIFGTIC